MTTVAIQGELGSFSHAAALQVRGQAVRVVQCRTFSQAFEAVESGAAQCGVLPIENSLVGSIHENYDLIAAYGLPIVAETELRISLSLIARPGTGLHAVRRVSSHPVALNQCRRFLASLRGIEAVASHDTAGSVRELMERGSPEEAAVASSLAAKLYGGEVLVQGIEDDPRNFTRFVVVAPKPAARAGGNKTSLMFTLRHEPGALWRALEPFVREGLNLTKIESRPVRGQLWEYVFYLDVRGGAGAGDAVTELRRVAVEVRVLGCYDAA